MEIANSLPVARKQIVHPDLNKWKYFSAASIFENNPPDPESLPGVEYSKPLLPSFLRALKYNFSTMAYDELMYTLISLSGKKKLFTDTKKPNEEEDNILKTPADYKVESLNRTRRIFRRLLLHNYSDETRHVTLTHAEPCHDREQLFENLRRMAERFKRHYGESLNYIAVPELHPGGHGYHLHVVINNAWFDYDHFREKIWCLGRIMFSKRPRGSASKNAKNLAKYLVKYIGKDMDADMKAKKRYSRGGVWRTDWEVRSGAAPEARTAWRKMIAYLSSLDVPYDSGVFRPYEGQVIYRVGFESGLFPRVDIAAAHDRMSRGSPEKPRPHLVPKVVPVQGEFAIEV
jgi:hypothetical protein